MRDTHFSALDLIVPLPDSYHFLDCGYQDNLTGYFRFIEWKHGNTFHTMADFGNKPLDLDKSDGFSIVTGNISYIAYKRQQHPEHDLRVRAHEETHVLDRLGSLPYLEEAMRRDGFDVKLFNHSYEERACMGGWYAAARKGHSIEKGRGFNPDDENARIILVESAPPNSMPRNRGFKSLFRRLMEDINGRRS